MKILLLGEYSNVHWTLAEGLRSLGHTVTVASNGDFWKGYKNDIALVRKSTGLFDTLQYSFLVKKHFKTFKDYDIVQIINPMFLEFKAERILPYYKRLRKQNKKVFMAAYGMDHYYVKACMQGNIFTYSELMVNGNFRAVKDNIDAVKDWTYSPKAQLNQYIAEDCNGIIAGLWEYHMSYKDEFPTKSCLIPFPVNSAVPAERFLQKNDGVTRFFIGIQKSRSEFKGTNILLDILLSIEKELPDLCQVTKVENVPFETYRELMRESDILIDQLYSPTPNMNSLLAMSQGLVVAGGGEEEPYLAIGEKSLRPIINLPCDRNEIYKTLKDIVLDNSRLQDLKRESIEYVEKHHTPIKVAEQYIKFWEQH